jgi:UDP-N-acetylmuramate dehydrogenase
VAGDVARYVSGASAPTPSYIVEPSAMLIESSVPLAPLTTLKVGGMAQHFVEAKSIAEVTEAVAFASSKSLPLFVLGGGSNLVISDAGWPGLVLKIAVPGVAQREDSGTIHFQVGAGEEWDAFVARAVARNCAGVECLSGIPGSVGGTPVQNVGAYGQEVADTIESVRTLDLRDGQQREISKADCGFKYRTSIFNTTARGRYIILQVTYALKLGGAAHIAYADLKKHFYGWDEAPTLADTREAVRRIRASKGMLITPGEIDCRSAGSFFKNPVLSAPEFDDLTKRATEKKLQIPSYPALDAQRKVSAAWLVEHSGFARGYSAGRVGISGKHSLAIVNRYQATAADVVALKEHIQQRVQDIWCIRLEAEPVFVGF